ncbi:MAG: hypothetical protein RSD49_08030 [Hafnia sp.]
MSKQEETSSSLVKREWCYTLSPRDFDITGCSCGNHNPQWSEYVGHLWCEACQIDFKPEHNGVFDGPIPIRTAYLLGLNFNRINLATMQLEVYNVDTLEYESDKPTPAQLEKTHDV